MSKIVNWGHWVVAALFAAWGLDSLWRAVVGFPSLFRQHPSDITYHVVSDAFLWVAVLACAWGIFKWRPWAHTLGIVLSAFFAVAMGLVFAVGSQSGTKPNPYFAPTILIVCTVLIWLVLPAVRAEYRRRSIAA
jgi:hypothetical protein